MKRGSKLPIISAKMLCKFLEKEGFVALRQKGSHKFYRHADGRTIVVPIHSGKSIGKGLLRVMLDELSISREYFLQKFKK